MRFQGLKLIAMAKAIKIILKNTVLLCLLQPFIQGPQCTSQTPRWALSTNAALLSKVSTFNSPHLPYSFDFLSHLFRCSISSRAYIHSLYSCSLRESSFLSLSVGFFSSSLSTTGPPPLAVYFSSPLTTAADLCRCRECIALSTSCPVG